MKIKLVTQFLHVISPIIAKLCFMLALASIPFKSQSQYTSDGLSLQGETTTWFLDQIGLQQSGIIEGSYFQIQSKAVGTHPFLVNNQWLQGSVVFRGELFEEVDLRYHIEEDLLLTHDLTEISKYNQHILLNKDQVDWFNISGHQFRKYSPKIKGQSKGFFEEIYKGSRLTLIVKHEASLEVVGQKATYLKTQDFILMMEDGDYVVKGRSAWLRILKPYKKALKPYMIANGIRKLKDADREILAGLTVYSENLMEGTR